MTEGTNFDYLFKVRLLTLLGTLGEIALQI